MLCSSHKLCSTHRLALLSFADVGLMEMSSGDEVITANQLQGLQGLPEELLDAVLSQLDARSRRQVFRTSKFLATALLRVVPRIQLSYPTQHDIQRDNLRELAPFMTEVLHNRQQPKLHLTLQPARGLTDAIRQRHRAEPAAAASVKKHWVAMMLRAVPLCGAVDSLTIKWTLSLDADVEVDGEDELLSGLLSLPPTLTQLVVKGSYRGSWDWDRTAAAVSSLTQLQQLTHTDENRGLYETGLGPMALLSALAHLPSLHTLQMSEYVVGQEQLGALLALTQITSLQVQRFSGLTSSWASTACSWRQLEVNWMNWVTAAYLPLHSLTHPLRLYQLVGNMNLYELEGDIEDLSIEVLAAAELNLCENNKAGLVLDGALCLSKATVDLLIEQYLSHSRRTAHQPPHPAVASSSSHSGPSTSLASSSSPEGHITPEGPGSSSGQGVQQGWSVAGAHPLMQRLGRYVKAVRIKKQGLSKCCLSSANQQALDVLFPNADVSFVPVW
ncbi:hypothetical protein QJQ45_013648 [Haematococcus lacustris]|nr:hypothetical protein QJQ45_013648 [Haematococcus lacustris]